jgi:hypothetical protein
MPRTALILLAGVGSGLRPGLVLAAGALVVWLVVTEGGLVGILLLALASGLGVVALGAVRHRGDMRKAGPRGDLMVWLNRHEPSPGDEELLRRELGREPPRRVSFVGWTGQGLLAPTPPATQGRQVPYWLEVVARVAGVLLPLAALVVAIVAL